jgi:hypothetical protein
VDIERAPHVAATSDDDIVLVATDDAHGGSDVQVAGGRVVLLGDHAGGVAGGRCARKLAALAHNQLCPL